MAAPLFREQPQLQSDGKSKLKCDPSMMQDCGKLWSVNAQITMAVKTPATTEIQNVRQGL